MGRACRNRECRTIDGGMFEQSCADYGMTRAVTATQSFPRSLCIRLVNLCLHSAPGQPTAPKLHPLWALAHGSTRCLNEGRLRHQRIESGSRVAGLATGRVNSAPCGLGLPGI